MWIKHSQLKGGGSPDSYLKSILVNVREEERGGHPALGKQTRWPESYYKESRLSAQDVSHKPHFILMPMFFSCFTGSLDNIFSFCYPTTASHNSLSFQIIDSSPHLPPQSLGLPLPIIAAQVWRPDHDSGPRYTLQSRASIALSRSSEKVFVATDYSIQR